MSGPFSQLQVALQGRYAIARELGRGGMATVYLAEDLKHHRPVALKVLRPEVAAALGRDRFLREIEVTAKLQHPHILQLYDSGEAGGFLYYVMPRVEGESLRDRLEREPQLTVHEAIEVAVQVGSALAYAHDRGVVHRDIKPENVMLQAGQAVVADFGIALAIADAGDGRLTATGLTLGTPTYMSPEQAAGDRDVDARTDVHALGVLLYEMLSGSPPFTGDSARAILAKLLTEPAPRIRSVRPSVPAPIEEAIATALAKDPVDRFETVEQFVRLLRSHARERRRLSTRTRALASVVFLAVVGLGVLGLLRWLETVDRRDWARVVAIPEIQRLLGESEGSRAFHLAMQARRYLPDDPTLAALLDASSVRIDLRTDPPGATVHYRAYDLADTVWVDTGRTPLDSLLLPNQQLVVRFELEGYRPLELSLMPAWQETWLMRLQRDAGSEDMVWIPAGAYSFGAEPVALDSFQLDRLEITNREYRSFVDAGGYTEPEYWTVPFTRDGERLEREQAMSTFRDGTGQPGPATWALSRPAEGYEDYPVTGVSWFEAAAYCAFAGKSLPTLYHWKQGAGIDAWDNILAASNFGDGPVPAGSSGGVGRFGTVDMAGNVREWVWNGTRDLRYILGGAWDSPTYLYGENQAIDPWSREPTNGFRCARYPGPISPDLLGPIEEPFFDFTDSTPVDDETFSIYREFYAYDPRDLDAVRSVVDSTADWIRERVEFTAAYPGERVIAHVFLPTKARPPFQTVVYFPGATAFLLRSSENISEMSKLMFLPLSGRALVYPVLKDTYERRLEAPPAGSAAIRRRIVWATQDIMRSVDYVIEQPEFDNDRLAYMGVSYGAELAVPVALEKRFSALVLIGAAFDPAWRAATPPEAAPWNFASRITTPVIVINGRQDIMHPYEEGQIPFFEAIDVPAGDKRFVVSEAGHLPPWNEVIRHTLDWLDQRLGPVATRR